MMVTCHALLSMFEPLQIYEINVALTMFMGNEFECRSNKSPGIVLFLTHS